MLLAARLMYKNIMSKFKYGTLSSIVRVIRDSDKKELHVYFLGIRVYYLSR